MTYSEQFDSLGQFLLAVARAGMSPNDMDNRLRWSSAAGANESFPAEGGFAVPEDWASDLIAGVEDQSVLFALTDRQPITKGNTLKLPTVDERSRANGSRFGGLRLQWADETQQPAASQPKWRSVDLQLNKLTGNGVATSEIFDDVPALSAILARFFKLEGAVMIDDGIVRGPGAGQMLGVLNSGALITVPPESAQAAATVRAENVVKMFARLWAPGHRRAVWLFNQELAPQIFALGDMLTFVDGPHLLGLPLIAHESCSAPGAVGDLILCDASQYVVGEKPAEYAESLHVRFLSHEQVFRFNWRVAGQPGWTSPLTPLNGSNTSSPFVTLAART